MKNLIILCVSIIALNSCNLLNIDEDIKGNYDSFRWETTGTGDVEFTVIPFDKNVTQYDSLQVTITRIESIQVPVPIPFTLKRTTESAETFNALYDAMNSKRKINGTFKPTLTTGGATTRLYLKNSSGEDEITNIDLRIDLLNFLTFVTIPQ